MNFHGCISFILSQNAYYLKIINIWTNTLRRINRYIKKRNIKSKLVSPHQFYVHALNMEVYIKRLQKPYLKVTERRHGLIYFFPESSICIVTRVTMKFWVKKLNSISFTVRILCLTVKPGNSNQNRDSHGKDVKLKEVPS